MYHIPPKRLWYTDVEPAYEKPAECECHYPPMPYNCVCVTEEDVANWNSAYNTLYDIISAGIPISFIASAAQLMSSADYWNQTYETVSANSGYWSNLSALSAEVSAISGNFNDRIDKLENQKTYVDNITITGNGTKALPYGVANVFSAYDEEIEALQRQNKEIVDAMGSCEDSILSAIAELSGGHIQNYELILQLMHGPSGTSADSVKWTYEPGMSQSDASTYTGKREAEHVYFNFYQG